MENQGFIRDKSWKHVLKNVSTLRIDSFATSTRPQIKRISLHLTCDTIINKWVSDGQTRHRLSTDTRPPQTTKIAFPITRNGVVNLAVFKDATKKLNTWLLPDGNHKLLVTKKIMNDMFRTIRSFSPLHNIELQLFYEVVTKQDDIMQVSDVTEWVMQRSLEERVPRMVPASDSSIKSLRRTIVVDGDDDDDDDNGGCETCSVCFEDFLAGSEVSCLPCSHVYHQDCIRKWLRTSHYCPNCRYEMPTN